MAREQCNHSSCNCPASESRRDGYCSDACKAAAYRRRHHATVAPVTLPPRRPRKPVTVYECDDCGTRAVGQQRCDQCATFMRRIGIGGHCPHCNEPVAISDLPDEEVNH